jgi:hypothetical protein
MRAGLQGGHEGKCPPHACENKLSPLKPTIPLDAQPRNSG